MSVNLWNICKELFKSYKLNFDEKEEEKLFEIQNANFKTTVSVDEEKREAIISAFDTNNTIGEKFSNQGLNIIQKRKKKSQTKICI